MLEFSFDRTITGTNNCAPYYCQIWPRTLFFFSINSTKTPLTLKTRFHIYFDVSNNMRVSHRERERREKNVTFIINGVRKKEVLWLSLRQARLLCEWFLLIILDWSPGVCNVHIFILFDKTLWHSLLAGCLSASWLAGWLTGYDACKWPFRM